MKNIINYLRYVPKQAVALFAVAVMVVVPTVVLAGYGPNRPTFDYNDATERKGSLEGPVFNSFVNTPNYGDERAFFDAKNNEITQAGGFKDVNENVEAGETYLLRIYVHNNANEGTNESGLGIAKNTQVEIKLPTATEKNLRAVGYISADNATPGTVTDTVEFRDDEAFGLEYVPGSARIKNGAHPDGKKLSDDIVAGGTKIGYEEMNGKLPGCFKYDALVTIKVKVTKPSLELRKSVKLVGDDKYQESVQTKPGDKLSWILAYKNDGSQTVDDVTLRDKLPPHVELVPGSVKLFDAARPNGTTLGDVDLFNSQGTKVGNYTTGSNGYIKFETVVKDDFKQCETTLNNTAYIRAHRVSETYDQAKVVVTDESQCGEEPEKPETPEEPEKPEIPKDPEVPTELPNTGPAEAAAGLMASGGLGVGVRSWINSRRKLTETLLDA